jgi:CYTH domain-containing protein
MESADKTHFEIERKFLIEYPDIAWLEDCEECRSANIVQTYLKGEPGVGERVRSWESGGKCTYYHTEKRDVTSVRRVETEETVSEKEYKKLLSRADPDRRPIVKTRYLLPYDGHTIEIDVYPFWSDRAIAEVELSDENEKFSFPDKIKIIKDVTDDKAYRNASLAQKTNNL